MSRPIQSARGYCTQQRRPRLAGPQPTSRIRCGVKRMYCSRSISRRPTSRGNAALAPKRAARASNCRRTVATRAGNARRRNHRRRELGSSRTEWHRRSSICSYARSVDPCCARCASRLLPHSASCARLHAARTYRASICAHCETDFFACRRSTVANDARYALPVRRLDAPAYAGAVLPTLPHFDATTTLGGLRFAGRRHGDGAEIHRATGPGATFSDSCWRRRLSALPAPHAARVSSSLCRWRSSEYGSADSINRTTSHALSRRSRSPARGRSIAARPTYPAATVAWR